MGFDMVKKVEFRPEDYGPDIARILNMAGGGKRLMPLVRTGSVSAEVGKAIQGLRLNDASVLAGLFLYCGRWDAAHAAADSVENTNGYFRHAIVHRQEPDPGNAAYWFGKTGIHPIFPKLAAEAKHAGYPAAREWGTLAFVEFCESAARRPGSSAEQMAMQVQLVEWQLLFDYCARGQNC